MIWFKVFLKIKIHSFRQFNCYFLKNNKISVSQIRQDKNSEIVPIIFVTQKTHENAMNKAIEEISKLQNIIKVENVIRVEQ